MPPMGRAAADEKIAEVELIRHWLREQFLAHERGEKSITKLIAGQVIEFPALESREYHRLDQLAMEEIAYFNRCVGAMAGIMSAKDSAKGKGWSSGQATFTMSEDGQLMRRSLHGGVAPATKKELTDAYRAGKTVHLVKE